MEWKKGKAIAHTGRTVRSRFAQTRGKRSEGLLVRSTITNPSNVSNEDEAGIISYSLGKQNRWLLPEVIKTNSVEFEGEVVLIERYNEHNKNRRQGTLSVFNSKKNNSTNDTSKKAKGKRTRCKQSPTVVEENALKTQYEVTYPNPTGWMSKSNKRPAVHQGKRKKNTCKNWMSEDDFGGKSDTECCYSEDENCFSEKIFDRTSSCLFDFDLLVDLSTRSVQSNARKGATSATLHREKESKLAEKCIFVDSDDEMHKEHLEILSQMNAGCSLFDVRIQMKNADVTKGQVQKRRQRNQGTRRQQENNNSPVSEEAVAPVDTTAPHVKPLSYIFSNEIEGVFIMLRKQDIVPIALKQHWGQMYKEGACHPRAFVLNVTPLLSIHNSEDVFIVFRVFEEQCLTLHSSEAKAMVTIVVCNDDACSSRVPKEFATNIEAKSADQKFWTVEDIVSVASICFCSDAISFSKEGMQFREPRQPRMSLDVFSDLFGWKSKTFSAPGAKQEIKESTLMAKDLNAASSLVASSGQEQWLECEICFKETQDLGIGFDVNNSFTSLRGCGHKFCDDCWRAHLKTQIQLGRTDLRCPGHDCTVAVDDVTLMSLVPSWYGRHLTKRLDTFLEIDPKWKWCPADQCNLVVKATIPQSPSSVSDECEDGPQPVPVACVCGSMWCFKCQEDAHWPATCEEARVFREENASYARLTTSKDRKLVTNIQVKHCPFCHYPIEKGTGCNHMRCVMCFKEFCWACLEKWSDYGHVCKKLVNLRTVTLPSKLVHVMSYKLVAVRSRVARTSFLICKVHRKMDRISKELNIYAKCFPLKPGSSRTEKRLNQLCENNSIHELKEVFNFKFQALLVLEGAAMRLSFTKDTSCSKKLAMAFGRLFFIVERMDEILKDFNSCLKDKDCLFKLKHFVKCGKRCIHLIGHNTAANVGHFKV